MRKRGCLQNFALAVRDGVSGTDLTDDARPDASVTDPFRQFGLKDLGDGFGSHLFEVRRMGRVHVVPASGHQVDPGLSADLADEFSRPADVGDGEVDYRPASGSSVVLHLAAHGVEVVDSAVVLVRERPAMQPGEDVYADRRCHEARFILIPRGEFPPLDVQEQVLVGEA